MARLAAVVAALAGLALILTGCGGGGGASSDTPAEFVSQTIQGQVLTKLSANGTEQPTQPPSSLSMWLDVDDMKVRVQVHATATVMRTTAMVTFDVILDAPSSQITVYNKTEVNGTVKSEGCMQMKNPAIQQYATMAKNLISEKAKELKSTGTIDGMRKFEIKTDVDIRKVKSSIDAWMALGDSNELHKMSATADAAAKGTKIHTEEEFTASTATAGKPDAKQFEVPSSFGKCVPMPSGSEDQVLKQMPVVVRAFFSTILEKSERKEKTEVEPEATVVA